ncbi:hypothetical protein CBF45_07435 [Bordetella sp. J329]|nr:hypothetical protein CBF45_07435 [Bordetella sp. J329]
MTDKTFTAETALQHRRTPEGTVQIILKGSDSNLDLTLSPEAALAAVHAIYSIQGSSESNQWNAFPLPLRGIGRTFNRDGSLSLQLLVGEQAAIPLRLSVEQTAALRAALDPSSEPTVSPRKSH